MLVRLPLGQAFARAREGGFAEGQTALTILLAAEPLGHPPGRRGGRMSNAGISPTVDIPNASVLGAAALWEWVGARETTSTY